MCTPRRAGCLPYDISRNIGRSIVGSPPVFPNCLEAINRNDRKRFSGTIATAATIFNTKRIA